MTHGQITVIGYVADGVRVDLPNRVRVKHIPRPDAIRRWTGCTAAKLEPVYLLPQDGSDHTGCGTCFQGRREIIDNRSAPGA